MCVCADFFDREKYINIKTTSITHGLAINGSVLVSITPIIPIGLRERSGDLSRWSSFLWD